MKHPAFQSIVRAIIAHHGSIPIIHVDSVDRGFGRIVAFPTTTWAHRIVAFAKQFHSTIHSLGSTFALVALSSIASKHSAKSIIST